MPETLAEPIGSTPAELHHDDLDSIGPVARVYALQLDADRAQRSYDDLYEIIAEEMDRASRAAVARGGLGVSFTSAYDHPDVVMARTVVEAKRQAASEAQLEVGGIVVCVVRENLPKLHKKLKALTSRAKRIEQDPITLTETDESIVLHYAYDYDNGRSYSGDFTHIFCLLNGSTPQVPGFTFVATLDHTEHGAIVNRVPAIALGVKLGMDFGNDDREDSEAKRTLDAIDLTQYRTADPRTCEHCHKNRNRKQSFVVYNHSTGETKRVGRQCLRDYTGIDNPERMAKVLETFFEIYGSSNTPGEKPEIRTIDFLTHAAIIYREEGGYVKGMGHDAIRNYWNRINKTTHKGAPQWVEPTDGDKATAATILTWVRNDWDEDNDFASNVKIALAGIVLPNEKCYGIAGAAFAARDRAQRDATKNAERKDQAKANTEKQWVGEVKKRETFERLTLTKITWVEDRYSFDQNTKPLMIMEDPDGNSVKWFASSLPRVEGTDMPPMEGGVYDVLGTVKYHDDDPQWGKSTIINRCKFTMISEPNQETE